jgi:dTMP kinase
MKQYSHVALEGIDGSGKTLIRKQIFSELQSRGVEALTTTSYSWLRPAHAQVITYLRYHGRAYPSGRILESYVADKEALTATLVAPHLRWRHVLTDRFVASDIVFQAVMYEIPPERSNAAYAASAVRMPDLTVFVDTPPAVAAGRLRRRSSDRRNPWDDLAIQERMYEVLGRLLYSGEFDLGPVCRIDNAGSLEATVAAVKRSILPLLGVRDP